ncbi:MAG: DUF2264 domain-containing protein [Clostridiales bacterium]|nr:DUF2264 domain-containing protein [Clostridiales bacterium]
MYTLYWIPYHGDGPAFHWDYYNSYVIQPMMYDIANSFRHNAKNGQINCRH